MSRRSSASKRKDANLSQICDEVVIDREPAGHLSWPEEFRLPIPMMSVTRFISSMNLFYKNYGLLKQNKHLLHYANRVELKNDQVTTKHLHALRLLATQFDIESIEHWCYSRELQLYGRADAIVRDKLTDIRYLVEIKTFKKIKPEEILQGALYLLILALEGYPKLESRYFLMAQYLNGKLYLQRIHVDLNRLYQMVKEVQASFQELLNEEGDASDG